VLDLVVLLPMVLAGLATAVGALPILAVRRISRAAHDAFLGFAGGIMLAVVALDLVPSAMTAPGADPAGLGLSGALGAGTIVLLARFADRLPAPRIFRVNGSPPGGSRAFLLFVALAIHNAPEGLATGLGYAGGLSLGGHLVALAIALQNVPEGLLVALPVYAETGSVRAGIGYAALSGLVEPTAGVLALLFLSLSPGALALGDAFAAGAMVAAVLSQLLPALSEPARSLRTPASWASGIGLIVLVHLSLHALGL